MLTDPHFIARDAIVRVADPKFGELAMQNVVPKLSATPGSIRWTGPALGQHNDEVYGDLLGLSEDERARLTADGCRSSDRGDASARGSDPARRRSSSSSTWSRPTSATGRSPTRTAGSRPPAPARPGSSPRPARRRCPSSSPRSSSPAVARTPAGSRSRCRAWWRSRRARPGRRSRTSPPPSRASWSSASSTRRRSSAPRSPSSLRARGIDTTYVVGFSTSGCVRASALDALQHGFRPLVVADACGDRDAATHDQNLFDLDAKYADVISEAEALIQLGATP